MPEANRILLEPLEQDAFSDFGDVIDVPSQAERHYFSSSLENKRNQANPDLSIARIEPIDKLPLTMQLMERHPHSSQTFIPMHASRYLVIVAPDATSDSPDINAIRAFMARGDQGITYKRAVWHHPMTVLDETADMAIFMWCDGSEGDEEFYHLNDGIEVIAE